MRAAFAVAIRARVRDHLAGAAAGRAAALNDEEALLRAHLAHSAAGRAGAGAAVERVAAAPTAFLARSHRLDCDGLFDARESFLEAELEVVAEVGAARGILLRARVHELAEDGREYVGKAVEAGIAERVLAAAVLEGSSTEAVVSGALLRVLEHIIGLIDRLEVRFLVGAAVVTVGVMLLGQATIGSLDGGVACAPRNAEDT